MLTDLLEVLGLLLIVGALGYGALVTFGLFWALLISGVLVIGVAGVIEWRRK